MILRMLLAYWRLNTRIFTAIRRNLPGNPWDVVPAIGVVAWVPALLVTGHDTAALAVAVVGLTAQALRIADVMR